MSTTNPTFREGSVASQVWLGVTAAMQHAEEIGGPDPLEYERLMVAIALEAGKRLNNSLAARQKQEAASITVKVARRELALAGARGTRDVDGWLEWCLETDPSFGRRDSRVALALIACRDADEGYVKITVGFRSWDELHEEAQSAAQEILGLSLEDAGRDGIVDVECFCLLERLEAARHGLPDHQFDEWYTRATTAAEECRGVIEQIHQSRQT